MLQQSTPQLPQGEDATQAYAQQVCSEVVTLINQVLTTQVSNTKSQEAAKRLAEYLSDDFSDHNNVVAYIVRETVKRAKERISVKVRAYLDDMIDVALARIDVKASIEYWMKQDDGKPITLRGIQKFEIDFTKYAHDAGLISIIFAGTGTGKTLVFLGKIAFEIGQDVNILEQLICATDGQAEKRGMAIRGILESPHYRKIFPHVVRDPQVNKWSNHEMIVKRTRLETKAVVTKDSVGNATAVDPTIACYGVMSAGQGSRAHRSRMDDIATYENSIRNPGDGIHIHSMLIQKWFTRRKSPLDASEEDYNFEDDPWRCDIIGTPWAENDPIYSFRTWPGAAVIVIGVNQSITAYNVQIWGLPDDKIELLRAKYATGTVKFGHLSDDLRKFCVENNLPTSDEYVLGSGTVKDKANPPKATMEIPLSRPRIWYLNEYKNSLGTSVKENFDRPYRCDVYSEGELAFPGAAASFCTYYKDIEVPISPYSPDGRVPIHVAKDPVVVVHDGISKHVGWRCYMENRPDNGRHKIATVDLSGINRLGTVLTVAELTPEYRRRIIEVTNGGFTGGDISTQIGEMFERHPDLLLCYVETLSMQKLFAEEMEKHKTVYPWWGKLAHFTETQSKKNDQQIGILTMGVPFQHGMFEIPDTLNHKEYQKQGHGYNCACGYCQMCKDISFQTRLAPVKSDVLITLWGIHIKMPHILDYGDPVEPNIINPQAFMQGGIATTLGQQIFGLSMRPQNPVEDEFTDSDFVGEVTFIPEGLFGEWKIENRTVIVQQITRIESEVADLEVGCLVQVHAAPDADGNNCAVLIVVLAPKKRQQRSLFPGQNFSLTSSMVSAPQDDDGWKNTKKY